MAPSTFDIEVIAKEMPVPFVTVLQLARPKRKRLPGYAAGAHIDVVLPNGLSQSYAICNLDGSRKYYRIAVQCSSASAGVSKALYEQIKVGDVLTISRPQGAFRLQTVKRSLLLGGGLGIAPLLPMAARLWQTNTVFTLHYYNKSQERAAFANEISQTPWAGRTRLHFSHHQDHSQLKIFDLLVEADLSTQVFACGPAGFIRHVANCATRARLSEHQMNYQTFALPELLDTSI